ncbi:MAG: hypothetical protein AAF447_16655 [Myxococcota bacterium]
MTRSLSSGRPRGRRLFSLLVVFAVACGGGSGVPAGATEWEPQPDGEALAADGWLLSVWGPSADDLFAVGGQPDTGRVLRYDGAEWREEALGRSVPLLNWVFGFGPDDVWSVGNAGTILRYDGSTWSEVPSPTDQDLWGIWGDGPDSLYAVGGGTFGREGRSEATLLRWDGTAWSLVALPELDRPTAALFKVWGSGPSDVIVVGQEGVLLRYDGAAWTQVVLETTRDLISVWGTGPDRIAIAGGRSNAVMVTYDGSTWAERSLGATPGLNGVWMGTPDVVHFGSVEGNLLRVDFASGELLDEFFTDCPNFPCRDVHAVHGVDGAITAVGGNFSQPTGPYRGLVYARQLGADE